MQLFIIEASLAGWTEGKRNGSSFLHHREAPPGQNSRTDCFGFICPSPPWCPMTSALPERGRSLLKLGMWDPELTWALSQPSTSGWLSLTGFPLHPHPPCLGILQPFPDPTPLRHPLAHVEVHPPSFHFQLPLGMISSIYDSGCRPPSLQMSV